MLSERAITLKGLLLRAVFAIGLLLWAIDMIFPWQKMMSSEKNHYLTVLEKGELVRILPDYSAQTVSVYAVYPSRQFLPEKTRVLVDFLISTLQIA